MVCSVCAFRSAPKACRLWGRKGSVLSRSMLLMVFLMLPRLSILLVYCSTAVGAGDWGIIYFYQNYCTSSTQMLMFLLVWWSLQNYWERFFLSLMNLGVNYRSLLDFLDQNYRDCFLLVFFSFSFSTKARRYSLSSSMMEQDLLETLLLPGFTSTTKKHSFSTHTQNSPLSFTLSSAMLNLMMFSQRYSIFTKRKQRLQISNMPTNLLGLSPAPLPALPSSRSSFSALLQGLVMQVVNLLKLFSSQMDVLMDLNPCVLFLCYISWKSLSSIFSILAYLRKNRYFSCEYSMRHRNYINSFCSYCDKYFSASSQRTLLSSTIAEGCLEQAVMAMQKQLQMQEWRSLPIQRRVQDCEGRSDRRVEQRFHQRQRQCVGLEELKRLSLHYSISFISQFRIFCFLCCENGSLNIYQLSTLDYR